MILDERKGRTMPKSKLNTEQIIGVLKQVEAGRSVAEVAREVGVSRHTIYAWKATQTAGFPSSASRFGMSGV
jgi:putative transposase